MECDYVINCRCVVISSLDGPLQRNWKELGIPKSSTTRHDFHDTAAQVTFSTNIWHQRTGWSLHLVHPSIVYPATKIRSLERPKSLDRFSPRKSNGKLERQWTHRLYPCKSNFSPAFLLRLLIPRLTHMAHHSVSLPSQPNYRRLQRRLSCAARTEAFVPYRVFRPLSPALNTKPRRPGLIVKGTITCSESSVFLSVNLTATVKAFSWLIKVIRAAGLRA